MVSSCSELTHHSCLTTVSPSFPDPSPLSAPPALLLLPLRLPEPESREPEVVTWVRRRSRSLLDPVRRIVSTRNLATSKHRFDTKTRHLVALFEHFLFGVVYFTLLSSQNLSLFVHGSRIMLMLWLVNLSISPLCCAFFLIRHHHMRRLMSPLFIYHCFSISQPRRAHTHI